MYRQSIWRIQLTFVLVLYMRLLLEAHAASAICNTCTCQASETKIICNSKKLASVPQAIPKTVVFLNLEGNNITEIEAATFQNCLSLEYMYLNDNDITEIEAGTFQNLGSLQYLYLNDNDITEIEAGTFQNLGSLQYLSFKDNKNMVCGCELPALMNYITKTFNRTVDVEGECRIDLGNNQSKVIPLLEYSQCKSFVFHLIYNSTFKKFNEYKSPAENISRAMEHELSNFTGMFEFEYCGLEGNNEIFTINCSVPVTITKDQLFKNILETFKTSAILRNLGIQQHNMQLIDENVCNENTSTDKDIFYWPMAKIGTKVTIPCHANVATRYCSSRTAVDLEMPLKCSPFTGIWQDPDMSQCYKLEWMTKQLKNMTRKVIDKENVNEISKKLLDVSQKSLYFKEEDIVLAVDIQEKMVPLISNLAANITANNMILSINNMINTPEEILVEAEQSNRTVNRMLDIIETIAEKIPLEEQQFTVLYSNLGIGVIKVEKDTFNGALYGVLYGNNETESNTTISDNSNPDPQVSDMMTFISLPNSLLKDLKNEERSTISRISFFSMQDDKLYRVTHNSSNKANTTINSHIIAANIPKVQITNLDEPVTIMFNLIDPNATNPQCVYWEKSPGQNPHWSTKGCKTTKNVPGEKVFCSCNHLTSFAILMDVYQEEVGKDFQLLSITSIVGCVISSVVLIITVLLHLCSKNLRKFLASKILVNLCISLAVTNLIFVVGMQEYTTRTTAVCKALAALLHYFLLTSLMWMAVEALHVCLAAVYEFKTYQTHFMMKSSILAWGLPAVTVAITLAINYTNNYIRISKVCWLSTIPFYVAFLAPVATILLFHLTMFSFVIWRLISKRSKKIFESGTRRLRIIGLFVLFSLFVVSWTLAFFAVDDASDVFTFLFGIFNALQGMFIFVCYCIYKKETRDVICLCLCKKNQMKGNTRNVVKTNKNSSSGNETQD